MSAIDICVNSMHCVRKCSISFSPYITFSLSVCLTDFVTTINCLRCISSGCIIIGEMKKVSYYVVCDNVGHCRRLELAWIVCLICVRVASAFRVLLTFSSIQHFLYISSSFATIALYVCFSFVSYIKMCMCT